MNLPDYYKTYSDIYEFAITEYFNRTKGYPGAANVAHLAEHKFLEYVKCWMPNDTTLENAKKSLDKFREDEKND